MAKKKKAWTERYELTAQQDAPDFRDYQYRLALVKLKPRLPVPGNLNIRDQGVAAGCTGFALAAVIDRLIKQSKRKRKRKEIHVSARMLYEMAKRYDEWPGDDHQGSSCRGAIKGWYNMGVCREKLYPSHEVQSGGFTVAAAKDARNNTIGAYYRLGSRISEYHAALAEVGAIFCSANVHAGWDDVDSETGEIPLRKEFRGRHAFAIVGYDDQGFWIQNSWGEDWGKNGTALWTYEDWLVNIQDAWVFRMALPTPQIWHLPARRSTNVNPAEKPRAPARAEIAGHFAHLDDGLFHKTGRYWSDLDDVRLTADLVADSDDYDHLMFYAHGGLNSPRASARRIAAMKETFKTNRIYPYHLMYDTGLLEELKDVVIGRRREAEARAGGFTEWLDKLVEMAARVPGRAMWREMKAGARLPFEKKQFTENKQVMESDNAGTEILAEFLDAFARSGKPKKLHLVGHSTGMILLSHLLKKLAVLSPGTPVASVSLMAPAGTLELFNSHVQPFLKAAPPAFRISKLGIYTLVDEREQADEVTRAYNKSLLYLVSRAFEEEIPQVLLGMEKGSKLVERRGISGLSVHYSKGRVPGEKITASETHGGFDNDPLTMNHILRRILRSSRQTAILEFTGDSLDY
jgi:pimeloyl-ACP methyl ester carboxylesterase